MKISEFMYRFRSTESLLWKHNELNNNEIHFGSLTELNDPMEGFKNIFWRGDTIIWSNLLKHYLLCLEHLYLLFNISQSEIKKEDYQNIAFKQEEDLKTLQHKVLFQKISASFFNNKYIIQYLQLLVKRRKIHFQELIFHLQSIHFYALQVIATESENAYGTSMHLISPNINTSKIICHNIKFLELLIKESNLNIAEKKEEFDEIIFKYSSIALSNFLDYTDKYDNGTANDISKNHKLIYLDFPSIYIKQLENIIYTEHYVACFTENPNNSSMWSHYADQHRGVCLKFKTNIINNKPTILLEQTIIGYNNSGYIFGSRDYQFEAIKYQRTYPEIDFFKSLGRLPEPQLHKQWYSDQEGNKSIIDTNLFTEKWREKYWKIFHANIKIKLKDWSYEKEYRLQLLSSMTDYSDKNQRTLKYNFRDLDGIIFGIKIDEKNKCEIVNIIRQKCQMHGRTDFNFYQSYYSSTNGKINAMKLSF